MKSIPGETALLEELRKHFLEDYPNPQRISCFPPEVLEREASKPGLLKRAIGRHIFQCSPCYQIYSQHLRRRLLQMRAAEKEEALRADRQSTGEPLSVAGEK